MKKEQNHINPNLSDEEYFDELIKSGLGVPPEFVGMDDDEYYNKLVKERSEGIIDTCSEEELFRKIKEDEREEDDPKVY